MKKKISFQVKKAFSKMAFLMSALVLSFYSFAQDKKVDVNINTKPDGGNSNFFMQPWVWIVGGAVFILLLIALLRSNSSKN